MSYCVIADVQGLNAKRTVYSAATAPTDVQVTTFIADIAAQIDAVLAAQFVLTPVITPASMVTFLVMLNALGAAALAESAQFPEFDSSSPSSTSHSSWLWDRYQAGLKSLDDGSAIDPSAPGSGADAIARTYLTDYPDDDWSTDGSTDGQQPIFAMADRNRTF